ncbi:MAG: M56 family metallopeptidase [Thermoanaerobaculia bacterium]
MDALFRLVLTNAALSGLLALSAWAASRLVRRQAVVHTLWLLALVKLVTPPLVALPVLPVRVERATPAPGRAAKESDAPPALATRATRAEVSASAVAPAPPAAERAASRREPGPARADRDRAPSSLGRVSAASARTLLPILLAAGALAVVGLSAYRFARFRRLLAAAEPAPAGLARRVDDLAESLGVRRVPPLLLVPARVPPMLWPAAAGPLLLLPRELLASLEAAELDALLAHELAHVRRRDHWVRFLEIGATALFWWYPVTWWSRRALRRAEERCCDEWVLRALPTSARAYARGILKSLEFLSESPVPLPAAASGAGPVEDLEARLKEILMTYPLPRLSRPVRVALGVAAIASLALFPTVAPTRTAQAAAVTVLPGAEGTPTPEAAPTLARAYSRALLTPPAVPGTPMPALAPRLRVASVPNVRTPLPYLVASAAPLALREGNEGDPALDAERRALDEQRRQLQLSQLELERKSLDLEAKVRRKEASEEIARMKAEGDAEGAARVEKRGALSDRRGDLEKRQLDLQVQELKLETEVERAAEAGGKAGATAESARAAEHAEQELEKKRQALEAETEKLDRELQALDAELRVHELRGATDELAKSLAEQAASLREALPESGAQKAELEKEIERLEAALGALKGSAPRSKSPAPAKTQAR